MTARTTESMVTFSHQFNLSHLDGPLPAGTYRLVVIDEDVPGLSFIAYRRAYTMLHLPAVSANTGRSQVFTIGKDELEAALRADQPHVTTQKEA